MITATTQQESERAVGRNLIRLRKAAGLSQVQLAEKVGAAPQTIFRIEQSRRFPQWTLLCKLADFFDVSLDEFRS